MCGGLELLKRRRGRDHKTTWCNYRSTSESTINTCFVRTAAVASSFPTRRSRLKRPRSFHFFLFPVYACAVLPRKKKKKKEENKEKKKQKRRKKQTANSTYARTTDRQAAPTARNQRMLSVRPCENGGGRGEGCYLMGIMLEMTKTKKKWLVKCHAITSGTRNFSRHKRVFLTAGAPFFHLPP